MDKRNSKTNLLNRITELEVRLEAVYQAGLDGIYYVGIANYRSRENAAIERLEAAKWDVLEEEK